VREKIIALASKRATAHHPGLLLQRYLAKPATGDEGDPEERRAILNAARQAGKSEKLCTIYSDAYHRWDSSFPNDGFHQIEILKTTGRLIIGLGSENVLETGLRLHHTYGTPLIPGSALKGLTAHYCDQIWGQRGTAEVAPENLPYRADGDFHKFVFGTIEEGGSITFHDAWITPDSLKRGALQLDVMTPHHSDWQLNKAPPTDFDNPKPVSFLSVSGEFLIRLSWNGAVEIPEDQASAATWISQTMIILKEALTEWGVGGKTSSGYGRLSDPTQKCPIEVGDADENVAAKPTGPIHKPRQQVQVIQRTIEGKIRYEADDGFLGSVIQGTPSSLEDGESTMLWIQRVDEKNKKVPYVFQVDEPRQPKSPSSGKKFHGGRGK